MSWALRPFDGYMMYTDIDLKYHLHLSNDYILDYLTKNPYTCYEKRSVLKGLYIYNYVKNRNEKLATAGSIPHSGDFSLRFFTLIFPGTGCFSFYIYNYIYYSLQLSLMAKVN